MEAKQLNRAKRQAAKIHGGKPSDYKYVEHDIVIVLKTDDGRVFNSTATRNTKDIWLNRAGVNYHVRTN